MNPLSTWERNADFRSGGGVSGSEAGFGNG